MGRVWKHQCREADAGEKNDVRSGEAEELYSGFRNDEY